MTESTFRWVRIHNKDELKAFYAGVLTKISRAARGCGYAIAAHGSMERDLDLIAVAWVAEHLDKDELAHNIHKAACGLERQAYQWEQKPAGRWATSLPICWIEWPDAKPGTGHIDLSVINAVPTQHVSQSSKTDNKGE